MSELREIRLHGNRQAINTETGEMFGREGTNVIACRDGFRFSVLAGPGCHCLPRPEMIIGSGVPTLPGRVAGNYPGPYTHVEVGFWNGKLPKPQKTWRPYCTARSGGRAIIGRVTVFSFVPVSLVYDLIRRHGGEAPVTGERAYGRAREIRNRRRELAAMGNLTNRLREVTRSGGRDAARWVPGVADGA